MLPKLTSRLMLGTLFPALAVSSDAGPFSETSTVSRETPLSQSAERVWAASGQFCSFTEMVDPILADLFDAGLSGMHAALTN